MDGLKRIDDWSAQRTGNNQGEDFREIAIEGKISFLEFTIKPNSAFWRAGFKLLDPNGTVLPLLSKNSLLFHLGSTPSREEYGFTAYLNGKWIEYLNKTQKYPTNKLLTIRLEINHKNFLQVFVNGSLEFKLTSHLENPNIREKAVVIAWGDENDYDVEFEDVSFGNWQEAQTAKKSSSTKNKTIFHKQTKDQQVGKSGNIITSFINNLTNPQKFFGAITVGVLVIIIGNFISGNSGANTSTPTGQPTIETLPTDSISIPAPNENFVSISVGESYTDPESNIVVGLLDVSVGNKANISITIPDSETVTYNDVVPGKVYNFDSKNKSYFVTIKSIGYVGSYIEIIIRPRRS